MICWSTTKNNSSVTHFFTPLNSDTRCKQTLRLPRFPFFAAPLIFRTVRPAFFLHVSAFGKNIALLGGTWAIFVCMQPVSGSAQPGFRQRRIFFWRPWTGFGTGVTGFGTPLPIFVGTVSLFFCQQPGFRAGQSGFRQGRIFFWQRVSAFGAALSGFCAWQPGFCGRVSGFCGRVSGFFAPLPRFVGSLSTFRNGLPGFCAAVPVFWNRLSAFCKGVSTFRNTESRCWKSENPVLQYEYQ